MDSKRLLPMIGHVRGKRSAVTCQLKCDNQCLGEVCNTTSNDYFRDIASSAVSRRAVLGGTAGAVALFGASQLDAAAAPVAEKALPAGRGRGTRGSRLVFDAINPVHFETDEFTVPEGYAWKPIIRWGDPLFADSPAFDPKKQTAAAARKQFGYNNDYTEIIEIPGSEGRRAVMFVNHEYTNENIMFPTDMPIEQKREIGMINHGLTVVELERKNRNAPYNYVKGGKLNRRIVIDTPYRVTGPAAGSELLKTKADPSGTKVLGTLGNCSGGLTPWGTLLSGEENYHSYFVGKKDLPQNKRYGITDKESVRGWEHTDPRFDTRNEGFENEANRFGWIVEVDPFDPKAAPRKHTALGRFKHEGANVIVGEDGHVVAYSGDDEKFDYLYKFVSKRKYRANDRRHNMTLLEEGDLYVAKFTGNSPASEIDGKATLPSDEYFDGTGRWLPLTKNGKSMVEGMSLEEVLVYTRLAADKLGATKMDRCEDVEPSLKTGRVYVACTNNSDRGKEGKAGPDEANPRTQNRDGHVIEIDELGSQSSTRFAWSLLLVCGDPATDENTYFAGYPREHVSPISCPDNLAFDSVGNLWISTDGAPDGIGYNDGLFKVTLKGSDRGRVQQFLSVPRDAETCGPIIRDQDKTVFVSVQHPGEDGTWEKQVSQFPDYNNTLPRPTVVQVYQKGRGRK
ncbi:MULTISPECIES: PhoX family protein [unclassified Luteococcus]|uniref:PhoX family protein n=1 Tax=unclassified Luteococcus TaxID=2639923 RepID=UPI00313BC393